ncbi:MAG: MBL fold metallo-hydrolase [Ruminococcaceae bacterium]|nr:MBL fold metallo-hydrolase [Oscillospiraceae bacterium]
MEDVSLVSLYSGSKGNCTYIRAGQDEILIDAGRSFRALSNALSSIGGDLSRIKAIFITHEHSDHVSALEMLSKKCRIPIHITEDSAKKVLATTSYVKNNLICHSPVFEEQIGELTVRSFPTPHDSDMSVGYTISLANGEKIGYATDIGHITSAIRENLLGSSAVVLESNHDVKMLENGPYPSWLKMRIGSKHGHLSNADCAAFIPELIANGATDIMLAHLSGENNAPDVALECAKCACQNGCHLCVARESEPTKLL